MACCPAHDDKTPSLSISEGENGRMLLKCFAGCSVESVSSALGLNVSDLMGQDTKPAPSQKKRIKETYDYQDEAGKTLFQVVRFEPKTFRQRRPDGKGGWVYNVDGVRVVPFHFRQLLANPDRVVFIVEGEKDVQALERIGCVATCNAGGALKWGSDHAIHLKDRDVIILPDNDDTGRQHAEQVAQSLQGIASGVKVVSLPGLLVKGGASDWIAAGGTKEKLKQLVIDAPLWEATKQPKPEPPPPKIEAFLPFPVDAVPMPVRSFIRNGAKAIGCDMSFLALPLLTAIAAAIGNTRRLELKPGWHAPPNLWTAIVGESGTAKTPAFKAVMSPVKLRQQQELEKHFKAMEDHRVDLAVYEKQLQAWKRDKRTTDPPPTRPEEPQPVRYVVNDTTVEALAPILQSNPRGLLSARDELSGWIASFDRYSNGKTGADASHWLSMHNGEGITVDRKTGTPKTIYVPSASVSVTGGIQPGILQKALEGEHRESGLAARLLLTAPPRKAKRWTEANISPKAEAELSQLFDRLYSLQPGIDGQGNPLPDVVFLSQEAKRAWVTFYDAHAQEQTELTGDLSSAWSKLEEYAARLALVVHFIRWAAQDSTLASDRTLDVESMEAGIVLVEWFKLEARRVYAMLDETAEDRTERNLVDWIKKRGGRVTVRQVQQGHRQFNKAQDAQAALARLISEGYGAWEAETSGPQGGRPTEYFVLHKPSTVYETPPSPEGKLSSVDVDTPESPDSDWGTVE